MATTVSRDVETPSPEWIARFVADVPSGMALFDPDLRYVAANASWINAFGICAEPLIGLRHDELDRCSGPALGELQRRALDGEAVEGSETAEHDATGRWRRWIVSARPRRDQHGAILGVLASIQELDALATEETLR